MFLRSVALTITMDLKTLLLSKQDSFLGGLESPQNIQRNVWNFDPKIYGDLWSTTKHFSRRYLTYDLRGAVWRKPSGDSRDNTKGNSKCANLTLGTLKSFFAWKTIPHGLLSQTCLGLTSCSTKTCLDDLRAQRHVKLQLLHVYKI